MPPIERRGLDYLFFGYFLLQIPSTLLFDTQGVYCEWLYPGPLKSLRSHYLETYRDPFLANAWKHPWYLSVCLLEHFFGMPFFVWAAISYYYGALARPKIVIPSLIYSVHTLTAVVAIWAMALLHDFSSEDALAPRTFGERLTLCSAYFPFFLVPLINIIDSAKLLSKQKSD